jgi:hypothetical protein
VVILIGMTASVTRVDFPGRSERIACNRIR